MTTKKKQISIKEQLKKDQEFILISTNIKNKKYLHCKS